MEHKKWWKHIIMILQFNEVLLVKKHAWWKQEREENCKQWEFMSTALGREKIDKYRWKFLLRYFSQYLVCFGQIRVRYELWGDLHWIQMRNFENAINEFVTRKILPKSYDGKIYAAWKLLQLHKWTFVVKRKMLIINFSFNSASTTYWSDSNCLLILKTLRLSLHL